MMMQWKREIRDWTVRTAGVCGLVQRRSERDGKQDKDRGYRAFDDVRDFEFTELHEVVAYPAVLRYEGTHTTGWRWGISIYRVV